MKKKLRIRLVLVLLFLFILPACDQSNVPEHGLGEVIDVHGQVENLNSLDTFVQKAGLHEVASIRVTRTTIEGDPIYYDLSSSGSKIAMTYDTRQDKFGSGQVLNYTCDELTRTETSADLRYTLKGCTGGNSEWDLLGLDFNVQRQDLFGFELRYGVNEGNVIDTMNKKLVKDLQNGKTASIPGFELTPAELQTIYKKLVLSNYLQEKHLTTTCKETSSSRIYESYYLKVYINSAVREYRWSECDASKDGLTMKSVVDGIREVVSKRQDYKKMPDVAGPYS